ncbi:MAG TPA: hypothetical protein VEV82_08420 [Actinomycetota bacterium]|nr:hypothetical protein [Actinomycetota bacterium]
MKVGGAFTLSGTVTSDESVCEDTVEVDITRKVGGTANFVPVESVMTDSSGDFELPQTADKNALYRASLDQDGTCAAAQSATKSIVAKLKVAVVANPKEVRKNKEVTLTATVTPCAGHAGLEAKLFRRVNRTSQRGFLL